jgi:hypothetical protein
MIGIIKKFLHKQVVDEVDIFVVSQVHFLAFLACRQSPRFAALFQGEFNPTNEAGDGCAAFSRNYGEFHIILLG